MNNERNSNIRKVGGQNPGKYTDESGVIAALTEILAARSVSLDKIFQQNLTDNRSMVVLITDQIRQGELDAAIEELLAHKAVVSDIQKLRVY